MDFEMKLQELLKLNKLRYEIKEIDPGKKTVEVYFDQDILISGENWFREYVPGAEELYKYIVDCCIFRDIYIITPDEYMDYVNSIKKEKISAAIVSAVIILILFILIGAGAIFRVPIVLLLIINSVGVYRKIKKTKRLLERVQNGEWIKEVAEKYRKELKEVNDEKISKTPVSVDEAIKKLGSDFIGLGRIKKSDEKVIWKVEVNFGKMIYLDENLSSAFHKALADK